MFVRAIIIFIFASLYISSAIAQQQNSVASVGVDPVAKAQLRQMVDAYKKLKAYSWTMDWTETAEVGPEDVPPLKEPTIEPNGPQFRVKIAFQKPNRYRIIDTTAQRTRVRVSNGKNIFYISDRNKETFKKSVPKESNIPLGFFAERSGLALEILDGFDPSKMYKERPKASPVTVSLSTRDNDDGFIRIVGVTQTKTFTRTNIYLIGKWDYLLRQFTTIEQTGTEKYVYDQKYINVRANPDLSSTTFSLTPHRKK